MSYVEKEHVKDSAQKIIGKILLTVKVTLVLFSGLFWSMNESPP